MSESLEAEALKIALDYLARPDSNNSVRTLADLPDMRSVMFVAAINTLAKELNDPALEEFSAELLILSRSKKRKGAKEIIDLFKAMRTRSMHTTILSRAKRIMVGRHEEFETE